MQQLYELQLREVTEELNFFYDSLSKSLVESQRLRNDKHKLESNCDDLFQRARRSEELESHFEKEVDAAHKDAESSRTKLGELKQQLKKLEEDKCTIGIKYVGLKSKNIELSREVENLKTKLASEKELCVQLQQKSGELEGN